MLLPPDRMPCRGAIKSFGKKNEINMSITAFVDEALAHLAPRHFMSRAAITNWVADNKITKGTKIKLDALPKLIRTALKRGLRFKRYSQSKQSFRLRSVGVKKSLKKSSKKGSKKKAAPRKLKKGDVTDTIAPAAESQPAAPPSPKKKKRSAKVGPKTATVASRKTKIQKITGKMNTANKSSTKAKPKVTRKKTGKSTKKKK